MGKVGSLEIQETEKEKKKNVKRRKLVWGYDKSEWADSIAQEAEDEK